MEDFNQVMMDQLLELGFQLVGPPMFGPEKVNCDATPLTRILVPMTYYSHVRRIDDLRLEITSRPADLWRVIHDFALDSLDLGAETVDHSIWLTSAASRGRTPYRDRTTFLI